MAVCIEILHLAIVCPFMRDVKSRRDWAAVRILTAIIEQLAVQGIVKVVYGIVESEQNDLRRLLDRNTTCASQLHYVARAHRSCHPSAKSRNIISITLNHTFLKLDPRYLRFLQIDEI